MKADLLFKSHHIDITPSFPCSLTYMNESQKNVGIFSNLEVNTMVFRSGEKSVYFVSIDTLFITTELAFSINDLINKIFGQTSEADIIPIASHTHYAPALEERRIKLGTKRQTLLPLSLVSTRNTLYSSQINFFCKC